VRNAAPSGHLLALHEVAASVLISDEPSMDEMRKAQFNVLYESLKDYHIGYIDSAFKIAGFLVLVAGWLITSKDARHLLATDPAGRRLLASGLMFGTVIYGFISWRVYVLSQRGFRKLNELNFMPAAYYEDHVIDVSTVVTFVLINAAMTGATAFFVAQLGRQQRDPSPLPSHPPPA
jgi:hypothetical protein